MSDKLAYSYDELADAASVGKTTINEAVAAGELVASYAGKKHSKPIILRAEAERWLASLPNAKGAA